MMLLKSGMITAGITDFIYGVCCNILTHLPPDKMATITDDIFRRIFMKEKFCILIKISLKFVPMGPMDNNAVLV